MRLHVRDQRLIVVAINHYLHQDIECNHLNMIFVLEKTKLIYFLIIALLKRQKELIPISSATNKEPGISFPPGGLSIFLAD